MLRDNIFLPTWKPENFTLDSKLEDKNFKKLYNDVLPEYKEIRKKSERRDSYLAEVDFWKNKYLYSVIDKNIEINSILEVGCATGDMLARFPLDVKFSNRYGVDISSKNIDFAMLEHPEINFICDTVNNLKFKEKEFDLLILSDIIEHIDNDLEFLKKASSLAKYVVVNVPLQKCFYYRYRKFGINDISGRLRAYDLDMVEKLIDSSNLEIINIKKKYVYHQLFWQKLFLKNTFSKKSILFELPGYFYKQFFFLFLTNLFYSPNLFIFLKHK